MKKHITVKCELVRDALGKLEPIPRATLTLVENTHSGIDFGSKEAPHKWQYEDCGYGTFLHNTLRMYSTGCNTHPLDFEKYNDLEVSKVTHKLRVGTVGSVVTILAKDWPMIREAIDAYNTWGDTQ